MSDGDHLLRAILDTPADDTPRLVYADWLMEHGDALRGEFIKLQCEMHQLGQVPLGTSLGDASECHECFCAQGTCEYHRILGRERTVYAILLARSFGQLPWGALSLRGDYDRGFLFRVRCTMAHWFQYEAELRAGDPITHVEIRDGAVLDVDDHSQPDLVRISLRRRERWHDFPALDVIALEG